MTSSTTFLRKAAAVVFFLAFLLKAAAQGADSCDFVVAQDGTGNFTTVQEAVNAVPDFRKNHKTRIFIKRGVYKEKIIIAACKLGVTLIGEEGAVITNDDYASKPNRFGENMSTSGSATIYIYGPDFTAENIVFENSAGPSAGQAVACFVAGDRAIFRNCEFSGHQDTLYTYGIGTRQYYENCYIEGTVDFIFGKALAVFNRCTIRSLDDGYVTAPATPEGQKYGYVFYDCRILGENGVEKVFLSRPWRPFAKAVFIRCRMEDHILPEGWNNWGNKDNEQTAYYAEYKSTGPGANPLRRASWSHQLDNIDDYDMETVLAGDDGWNPLTGFTPRTP